jgi:hypothetical protein
MVTSARRLAIAALLVASACGPKEVKYNLKIITQGCDATNDPFAGVQFIRVKVVAPDLPNGPEAISNASSKMLKVPEVPVGEQRALEVRAFDGDPNSGGRVISVGRSSSFDVPEIVPADLDGKSIELTAFLRRVNTFSAPVSAQNPGQCQRMNVPRAGHSATLLKNGKVYFAGGYNYRTGSSDKSTLSSAEVFNPATGTFSVVRDLNVSGQPSARAFHTATLIPSGQVMLWGGEFYTGSNTTARNIILFYDADEDAVGLVPGKIPRTQHLAVSDKGGRVLIVGGFNSAGAPVTEVEWFDPLSNEFKTVEALSLARVGGGSAAVNKGEFIAVAGGTEGLMFRNDIRYFKFTNGTFVEQQFQVPPRLADPGRRRATAVSIRDGADLMLLGGFSDPKVFKPLGTSEIVNSGNGNVAAGPNVAERGDICVVKLADGTVLGLGGRSADTVGTQARSDASVEVIRVATTGAVSALGAPALPAPRYFHTCTALADGTVLVTGGVNESSNGAVEILQDAWIYQPAPTR